MLLTPEAPHFATGFESPLQELSDNLRGRPQRAQQRSSSKTRISACEKYLNARSPYSSLSLAV